ncbi:hypothetical protein COPR103792_03955 [Corynebacterium propinquum]
MRKHPRRDASGWAWCSDESAFYMGFSMPLMASALSLNESIDLWRKIKETDSARPGYP